MTANTRSLVAALVGSVVAVTIVAECALKRGDDLADFNVSSQMVADAANYLLPKMPGVLKQLGVDPAGLAQRLSAQISGMVQPASA